MVCLIIVLAEIFVIIIENPYRKFESVRLPYVNRLMYMNYTFTSLLFCPKTKHHGKKGVCRFSPFYLIAIPLLTDIQ